jgi:molybdopterin/thiamine biosynthesis adenylyltransferase
LKTPHPLEALVLPALANVKAVDVCVEESTGASLKINFSIEELPLQILFKGDLMFELPTLYIRNPDYYWGHPHISPCGNICISDRQGVVFNPDDVDGVVEFVVTSALTIIEDAKKLTASEKHQAFANELQDYLSERFVTGNRIIEGGFGTTDSVFFNVNVGKKEHSLVSITASGQASVGKQATFHTANVIKTSIERIPPMGSKPDINWLNSFLNNHPALELSKKRIGGLVIRVANDYGYANFAISFVRGQDTEISQLNFYSVKELTAHYYAQRGGTEIKDFRVAIAGVGAIGSRVAELLCMSGITNLSLIDSDVFINDNIYRHVLGKQHVGKYKVNALAEHLKQRFLELTIDPIPDNLESYLASGIPNIDCLILTTGNMVLERHVVKRAKKEGWPFQIVCGWVEALGLGGHAISMTAHEKGCLECLHIVDGNPPGNLSRTSYLEPDQKITKNLMGCIGFLPYSGLDALKSAQLITDFVLSQSAGYGRWVGPEDNAVANNIKTSEVYKNAQGANSKLVFTGADIFEGNCPCCNL